MQRSNISLPVRMARETSTSYIWSCQIFYPVAAQLSVENELLMNGNRLVIPSVLQKEILEILHKGHQGISDNGPQYSSEAYSTFSKQYGFKHITSSPYHPQGNGEAERGVQTMKSLLRKAADLYIAMLVYRSTPLEMGYSPAEGRRLRTTLPMVPEQLVPKLPPKSIVKNRDIHLKERQKDNFDNRRGVKEPSALPQGDSVWVPDRQSSGEVIEQVSPRSYVIQTPEGSFR